MTDRTNGTIGESPVGLLGNVVSGFARLVQGEFALARAEAKRSLDDAISALGKLVFAAIFGVVAMNVLAGAAVAGLVEAGLAPLWASVIVGVALLVLAYVLGKIGLGQLSPSNLAPKHIMKNLSEDAQTLKSMVKSDDTSNNRS